MQYNDSDCKLFELICLNISFTHGLKSVNDSSYDSLVYCVIVMVSGKIMFGFVLSSVTSALASTEALRSGFEEKVKETQVGIVIGKFFSIKFVLGSKRLLSFILLLSVALSNHILELHSIKLCIFKEY